MGSPLSFPILCVINFIGYKMAIDRWTDDLSLSRIPLKDLPVLINGDDITFYSDDKLYDYWREEIHKLGFRLSQGKNYFHEKYMTINSVLFHFGENDNGEAFFREIQYLDAGMLTGQTRKTGRMEGRRLPIWDYYNRVVSGSRDPLRSHRRFLHYHKKEIDIITRKGRYNLFAPFERGGLGFNAPKGLRYRFTNIQRRWASCLDAWIRKDPSSTYRIALVQSTKKPPTLAYYRKKVFDLLPKTTPLDSSGRPSVLHLPEEVDTTVPLPPLCEQRIEVDSQLAIRHPSREVLKKFKTEPWNKMSDVDIIDFPWKAFEVAHARVDEFNLLQELNRPKLPEAVPSHSPFEEDGWSTDCTVEPLGVPCDVQSVSSASARTESVEAAGYAYEKENEQQPRKT
jgi:hypothetical protein